MGSWGVVVGDWGGGGGGEAAGVYLMGDSLERKSRRLGSRSRRGSSSLEGGLEGPQGQPIVGWLGGDWVGGLESREEGRGWSAKILYRGCEKHAKLKFCTLECQ